MSKIIQGTTTQSARINAFLRFVGERENMRKLKEAGKPRPWTSDPVLANGHFCNVRRADDRVTKWIGEWVNTDLVRMQGMQEKTTWFAYVVARWFNRPETLTALTPALHAGWGSAEALRILRAMDKRDEQIFNGAYIINGAKGMPKYESVVKLVLSPVWKDPPMRFDYSIERTWKTIRGYYGMGSFMAGQIVADWQTFGVIHGKDVNTWAPLGPGSGRGLVWVYGLTKRPSQDRAVALMQQMHGAIISEYASLGNSMSLHDVQNCFCEFSKYVKGGSKRKYHPHDTKQGTLL